MEQRFGGYTDDGSEEVTVVFTHQEPVEERETRALGEDERHNSQKD